MRRNFMTVALLTMLLILAACGGGGGDDGGEAANGGEEAPAVDGGNDNDGGTNVDGSGDDGGTAPADGADGGVTVPPAGEPTAPMAPPVGELATPAATPEVEFDPEDPANEPLEPLTGGFEYIYFQQEGGQQEINIVIEVYADGRVVRDGLELPVPAEAIERLATRIDTIDFFNIIATFLGPPPDENDYRYLLFVRSADQERSIRAQDGFTPPEIVQLFSAIRSISDDARRAAGA